MSQFIVLPPAGVTFDCQASPTFALVAILPVVSLPEQYPALPSWVYELCDQIGPQARQDYALLTVCLFRSFAQLVTNEAQIESVEALLAHLSALDEMDLQGRILHGLATPEGERRPEITGEQQLRDALQGVSLPVGNESIRLDVDRAAALLGTPTELKQFMISRLNALWHDHLRLNWEKSLPAARQEALRARRHFAAGDVPGVFRAVTGRSFPEAMLGKLERIRRVLFCPIPFYGPYCICSFRPEAGELRVGYGVGIQPAMPAYLGGDEATIPGGLLPVLEALADETRLQMLVMIRDRGQGTAQEFISELGLSQPATSRHLRLLESTGMLVVERIEGIKWYRLNQVRGGQVANLIKAFLTPGAHHSRLN